MNIMSLSVMTASTRYGSCVYTNSRNRVAAIVLRSPAICAVASRLKSSMAAYSNSGRGPSCGRYFKSRCSSSPGRVFS